MAANDINVLQEQADGSLKETLLTPTVMQQVYPQSPIAGPMYVYRYGGTDPLGQLFENSGFVGPDDVGTSQSFLNNSPVGGYGFYGGWDDLEYTRMWVNPRALFPNHTHVRMHCTTRCSSVWGDGVHTMLRLLEYNDVQTTLPAANSVPVDLDGNGIANPVAFTYGGLSNNSDLRVPAQVGIYSGISGLMSLSTLNRNLTFIAYFAAYNGGNGGRVRMVTVTMEAVNL